MKKSQNMAQLFEVTSPRLIIYHAHTLLLFTGDQIFDTVIPGTAFSALAAKSGSVLDLPSQDLQGLMSRIPWVSLWLWLLILQACLQNQRSPASIEEDIINKPWRPIPSNRATRAQTEHLLIFTYLIAGVASYALGALPYWAVYVALLIAYNELGGSDYSGTSRNVFCGAAFFCYFGGALKIALGPRAALSMKAIQWILLLTWGVLATTFHTQDFRDEAGDRARGRRTLVTELGRKHALWTVVLLILFWSLYIPLVFFEGKWPLAALPMTVGAWFIYTAIHATGVESQKYDRRMYKLWCLWIFGLCPLPLLSRLLA
ncbi:UbiA prenyltransferase family-domain-containing protein [Paraphoma chrysanthemicola]|uniref:UbiA prenyltransferase family-domain-containing protein n=1 Tax=Paraphoma chrysanthemicola TaxID=798071 RepID=A0A8K0VXG5_9PLEO|nr:UbiA prenyltransferase family-domain-containing protein [Paraphoma chrysanthemicola]